MFLLDLSIVDVSEERKERDPQNKGGCVVTARDVPMAISAHKDHPNPLSLLQPRLSGGRGISRTSVPCCHRFPTSWFAGPRTCTPISKGVWHVFRRRQATVSTRERGVQDGERDGLGSPEKKGWCRQM